MRKFVRFVIDIFMLIFALLFLLCLLYFIHGSLEFNPSKERQSQIRDVMALFIFLLGGFEISCLAAWIKLRK